jgi:hypothetical protein
MYPGSGRQPLGPQPRCLVHLSVDLGPVFGQRVGLTLLGDAQ